MPVITRQDLLDAAEDTATLEIVVNGAPDRPNPGQPNGTVTTRNGRVLRTVANILASLDIVLEEEAFAAEVLARINGDENLYNQIIALAGAMITVELYADIAATDVPAGVQLVRTTGYTVAGLGGAVYLRTATTGATAWRTQSADGAWWKLAETAPNAMMVGALPNAQGAGTPTDATAALQALAYSGLHDLRLGDNFQLAAYGSDPAGTGIGGYRIGSATIQFSDQQTLTGMGWATKLVAQVTPAVSALIGWNNSGTGNSWFRAFPGMPSSKIGEFYMDGRPATDAAPGTKLTAIRFGGSCHFHNLHFLGFHTCIKQIRQYCDNVTIERVGCYEQPADTNLDVDGERGDYAVDLEWSGDGVRVSQLHTFRNDAAYGAQRRQKALRMRYKRGAVIEAGINGDHMIDGCTSVDISTMHMESGVITFRESSGSLRDSSHWMRGDANAEISVTPIVIEYISFATVAPMAVALARLIFVYEQNFPGGYTTDPEKPNFYIKNTPAEFLGTVTVDNLQRSLVIQTATAALSTKFGVTCGIPDFDRYSHFASTRSTFRNGEWIIEAATQDLTSSNPVLSPTETSSLPELVFQSATGTYYYRAQALLDVVRLIGVAGDPSGAVSAAAVNGGVCPVLLVDPAISSAVMMRIFRGTSAGSYDSVVDVPLIGGRRLVDTGTDIAGYAWQARTAGAMDAINAMVIAGYRLSPGVTEVTAAGRVAYGSVDMLVRTSTEMPTLGNWNTGDRILYTTPINFGPRGDTWEHLIGWHRKTTGTGHVLNTDWEPLYNIAGHPVANSDAFTTASSGINTAMKVRGRQVLDTTSNRMVYASNSGATDVWRYASDGTTAYTPV